MAFTNVVTRTVISSSVYNANLTEAQNQLDEKKNSFQIENLSLASSVSGNALTIAVKTISGSNASATSPIKVGMRSSDITSGVFFIRSITSSLSMTVSSGSTLGQTSSQPWALWIYLIDNAGTLELAISGSLFHENQLISTTAEGGAGAADSITAIYSTTARSNVSFRLIGKLVNTQATAGTWASAGSQLQVGHYGSLVQTGRVTVQKFTSGSGTYVTPPSCISVRVTMVGGGGGGGGSSVFASSDAGAGSNGNDSTFGTTLLSALAGLGGGANGSTGAVIGGEGGGAGLGTGPVGVAISGGKGGGRGVSVVGNVEGRGGDGGVNPLGGNGNNGGMNAAGNAAKSNTGGGGGGASSNSTNVGYAGAGGGAGGYVLATISTGVTGWASSFPYVVGAGGGGGTAGTNGYAGGAGGSGFIMVEEFYA